VQPHRVVGEPNKRRPLLSGLRQLWIVEFFVDLVGGANAFPNKFVPSRLVHKSSRSPRLYALDRRRLTDAEQKRVAVG
jgi:hypothetical protein